MRTLLICLAGFLLVAAAAQATPGDQATFDKAVAAYDAGHYEEAFAIFSELAENEDVAAMRNIALMLRRGQGVERNPKKALKWYAEAAHAGLATAQADLGIMLLDGEAGKPDQEEGVRWLTFAAEAGHPAAQFRMGELYEKGEFVEQDVELARKLYEAAAARGYRGAKEKLAALAPSQSAEAAPSNAGTAAPPLEGTTDGATEGTAAPTALASVTARMGRPVVMMDPIPDKPDRIGRSAERPAKPIMVQQQPPPLRVASELSAGPAPAPEAEPAPPLAGKVSLKGEGTMHKTFFSPPARLAP